MITATIAQSSDLGHAVLCARSSALS